MNEINRIEKLIKQKEIFVLLEDIVRYIEYKTVTKLDIQYVGFGYRISGMRWNTESDCEFAFLYESHKTLLREALLELAVKLANNELKNVESI